MSRRLTRTPALALAVALAGTAMVNLVHPAAAAAAPVTAPAAPGFAAAAVEKTNKYWNTNSGGVAGTDAWGWQTIDTKGRDVIWGYVKDTALRDGKAAKVVFRVTYFNGSKRTLTTTAAANGQVTKVGTHWLSNAAKVQVRECAGAKCGKNWTIYSGYDGAISRGTVLARARHWLRLNVPYNQEAAAYDVNKGRKFRTDCSGFVSMTWGLTYSRNTETLKYVSKPVAWGKLKPGDMVLKGTGPWAAQHVKLFEKWANKKHTAMWIIEAGATATDMNHKTVTVAWLKSNSYQPRKYNNIR
jgi:hypothetical protein